MKETKGLHELYHELGEDASAIVWGNAPSPLSRRGFLSRSALRAMAAAIGGRIVFGDRFPAGLIPAALAQTLEPFKIAGKDGLIILNDRPVNAETPAHFLDDAITPANRLFVRNNGHPPPLASITTEKWTLEIAGPGVDTPTVFTLADLKKMFENVTRQILIECGGNGRSEFSPPASGNQWTIGAVGCPTWTGVRMRDVLKACGVNDKAVYTAYYGKDTHLSGDPKKDPISRGVPIAKALDEDSLIAWAMNGADIPWMNGHPLRLITGGFPASTSGKWIDKLLVRDQVHDGAKMTGTSYRVPRNPVAPGTKVPDEEMVIIEAMPVKSLLTSPKSGIEAPVAKPFSCRGHAWAGENKVTEVHTSIDFGSTWQKATLAAPVNRFAWQHWRQDAIKFPEIGYYEVWVRATDDKGHCQPMILPGWNPKGYLNNACHRIAVQAI
ncbi:MAG: DMSO/TMAO reductase YedYZ molybdopterin-dependent catalytic subunit [Akkermansiaceae bacterium]|jgi:DMSO/TMAO reductase YedYZ molybdopterin-dependent catalytic subunit